MNENWCVFCIAVLKNLSPEQAFRCYEDNKDNRGTYTAADVEDMKKLKQEGMTYKAIGEIYGISRHAIYNRLKKDRPTAMETANKEISYSY